jgi:uncharacterized protein (AIM24 family)
MLQVRTRHTPTFGVARLTLAPSESALIDPASVVATSYGLGVERKGRGGAGTCTAGVEGGWVDLAPPLPGDLHVLELDGSTGWCVAGDGWLGAAGTVSVESTAPPLRALFGGDDGGFLRFVHGRGAVVLACYGMLDVVTLEAGELVTIDSGHVVGFADTVQCRLRALVPDAPQSVRTGRGLVFDFAGPALVLTRTRSPHRAASWLRDSGSGRRS